MNILVVSSSLIIRSGLINILENENIVSSIKQSNNYEKLNLEGIDTIITDTNGGNFKYLNFLKNIKDKKNTKIMILDFKEDKEVFGKIIELGFDAYILPNIDSESIPWAINQIQKGKKYHDVEFIDAIVQNNNNLAIFKELTSREKEITMLVSKGKSNLEIANELCISTNTVKKHISNVLSKLNLKDRIQITLYVLNNNEI